MDATSADGSGPDGTPAQPTPADAGPVMVVNGDAGVCSGTLYSAGAECPNNAAPAAGATLPKGGCTVVTGTASVKTCAECATCPPDHQTCCPGGKSVGGILFSPCSPAPACPASMPNGKKGGTVTFYGINAPVEGDYNIAWYYYCGNTDSDKYTSATCPMGVEGSPTGPAGCREAQFVINGALDPTIYEMPCFLAGTKDGQWSTVHTWVRNKPGTSTLVPFHLKAGSNNTIEIYSTIGDFSDMASIRVPDGT
jgi:hypothetical protein